MADPLGEVDPGSLLLRPQRNPMVTEQDLRRRASAVVAGKALGTEEQTVAVAAPAKARQAPPVQPVLLPQVQEQPLARAAQGSLLEVLPAELGERAPASRERSARALRSQAKDSTWVPRTASRRQKRTR